MDPTRLPEDGEFNGKLSLSLSLPQQDITHIFSLTVKWWIHRGESLSLFLLLWIYSFVRKKTNVRKSSLLSLFNLLLNLSPSSLLFCVLYDWKREKSIAWMRNIHFIFHQRTTNKMLVDHKRRTKLFFLLPSSSSSSSMLFWSCHRQFYLYAWFSRET